MTEAATAEAPKRTRVKGVGVARALLCVLIVLAPLLLGGVPTWAPAILLPLALSTFAFAVWGRRDVKVPLVAMVPLAVAVCCVLQALPLPPVLLDAASPTSAGLRDFALVPLGLSAWRPISLDPAGTWREALKWSLYAATVLAALHLTLNARSNKLLPLQCIAVTGAALVVVGGLHALFGVEELFGIYKFRQANPPLLTPFGNPNHLAGFLLLAGTLAAGLLLDSRTPAKRATWGGVWAACCAGVLISNSRAGIATFVLVQMLVVFFALWRIRKETLGAMPNAVRLSLALVLAALVGIGVLGDRLQARFSDTSSAVNKFAQWPHALELVRDCWRFGSGRGTYEAAFTRYYGDHAGKTFTHPENIVLQWTAEFGVPLAMAFAVAAGLALYRLWRGSGRSHWEVAALLAGVGVAVHNLADFNLEYPGVSVPLAAVLGVVAGSSEALIFRRRPLWLVAALVAVVGGVGAWRGMDSLTAADDRLYALAKARTPAPALQEAALAEIDAHPADYFLYDIVAAAWVAEGDPRIALAFANRALWLFPNDASAHLVAARSLRALGKRSQALLEYRLTAETGGDATAAFREAGTYAKTADELWTLTGGAMRWVLPVAANARSTELSTQLLLRAAAELAAEPGVQEVVLGAVKNLTALGRLPDAREVLEKAQGALPPSAALSLARAHLERASGDTAAVEKALDDGLKRWPGQFELTCERVAMLTAGKKWFEARALLARANASAIDSHQRLELTLLEASVDMEAGLTARALEAYRTAVRLSPSTRTHTALASALTATKHYDESVAELRAAQRFEGPAGAKGLERTIETIEALRDAEQIRNAGP